MEDKYSKLLTIAKQQLQTSEKIKKPRFDIIKDIEDLYYNRQRELLDNRINITYPIMAGQIDTLLSKIDDPPTVDFVITRREKLAEKVKMAWKQDMTQMRAMWARKDRAEKKLALIYGRGISKIYASCYNDEYEAHYDVVHPGNFGCDPTRGNLKLSNYVYERNIFKTASDLKKGVKDGRYRSSAVKELLARESEYQDNIRMHQQVHAMEAMELDIDSQDYIGVQGYWMTEQYLIYKGEWWYVFYEPVTMICVKACRAYEMYSNKTHPYVSWAVNYDEYNFWSKGAGDDIMPIAEGMKIVLNEAMENTRRRNRPMRVVQGNQFEDPNQLMEYYPDNVIVSQVGVDVKPYTLEVPEISSSLSLVTWLNNFMGEKTGVTPQVQGVADASARVGVYYGALQQVADRIGVINKAYSESYAEKAYLYFWGLKDNLSGKKAIEMLGPDGYKMIDELDEKELIDVDDVDDIITTGGFSDQQNTEIENKRKSEALSQITRNPELASRLSTDWLLETTLSVAGFTPEQISSAKDKENEGFRGALGEADFIINQILLGKSYEIYNGANPAFLQRMLNYLRDNINWVKVNAKGEETGIDIKEKKLADAIKVAIEKHVPIVIENMNRTVRNEIAKAPAKSTPVDIKPPTQQEIQQSVARPFEGSPAMGTPEGTASISEELSTVNVPNL